MITNLFAAIGALTVIALACVAAWKAIESYRNRRRAPWEGI